ncbi:signal peptidase II [Candidatus Woesearchaeota archaeon]|nr:signal peptidase II [Candidatus Woesearchaeota archaeon]
MKKNQLFWLVVLIVLILDQLIKLIIKTKLIVNQSVPVIKNIFHITYIQNTGAGFGILKGQQTALIWFAVFIIGVILYNYDKIPKDWLGNSSIALILAGAIGNLIDRLFLRYVIDFLDFRIWPAFNIADSALTLGVIGFIIYSFRQEKKSKK